MRLKEWLVVTLLIVGAIFIALPVVWPTLAASWLMRGAALLLMITMFVVLLKLPLKANK